VIRKACGPVARPGRRQQCWADMEAASGGSSLYNFRSATAYSLGSLRIGSINSLTSDDDSAICAANGGALAIVEAEISPDVTHRFFRGFPWEASPDGLTHRIFRGHCCVPTSCIGNGGDMEYSLIAQFCHHQAATTTNAGLRYRGLNLIVPHSAASGLDVSAWDSVQAGMFFAVLGILIALVLIASVSHITGRWQFGSIQSTTKTLRDKNKTADGLMVVPLVFIVLASASSIAASHNNGLASTASTSQTPLISLSQWPVLNVQVCFDILLALHGATSLYGIRNRLDIQPWNSALVTACKSLACQWLYNSIAVGVIMVTTAVLLDPVKTYPANSEKCPTTAHNWVASILLVRNMYSDSDYIRRIQRFGQYTRRNFHQFCKCGVCGNHGVAQLGG
jgi:hypothetical protein